MAGGGPLWRFKKRDFGAVLPPGADPKPSLDQVQLFPSPGDTNARFFGVGFWFFFSR